MGGLLRENNIHLINLFIFLIHFHGSYYQLLLNDYVNNFYLSIIYSFKQWISQ